MERMTWGEFKRIVNVQVSDTAPLRYIDWRRCCDIDDHPIEIEIDDLGNVTIE